jgi:hypothetical protein
MLDSWPQDSSPGEQIKNNPSAAIARSEICLNAALPEKAAVEGLF